MKAYVVGGAVRDRLLGRPVSDRDWVVVGATPEAMVAAGFQPVGRDFPVFLHPHTREEHALARTERKTARGYHGFAFHAAPDVTLEDDLARRDLTINAIAEDPESGALIDPFDGRGDLERRILRHVSPAFAEDPVRLLRCARFAARFTDFRVAPQTVDLLRRLVDAGEVDALVPERVWRELSRGLLEERPDRMFEVLRECGALARLLPEVDALFDAGADGRLNRALRLAADAQASLPVRYAVLCMDLDACASDDSTLGLERARAIGARWRVDHECQALAELAAREHRLIQDSDRLDAAGLVALMERCDAWRRPQRYARLLDACACDAQARTGSCPQALLQRLGAAFNAARSLNLAEVTAPALAAGLSGPAVGERVRAAREARVAAAVAPEPAR